MWLFFFQFQNLIFEQYFSDTDKKQKIVTYKSVFFVQH